MIDTIALKQTILDLATSGKLSGDFSCLDRIEDIVSSIPEASNKRKKLLQQEFDYEAPYAIPKHWQWLKLGEISSYGDTPKKMLASEADSDVWLLELEDIEAGGRLLKKRRISESSSIGEKTYFRNGQVLYSKLRPYLKKVLIADEEGICTPEMIAFDVFGGISAKYILYCLLNSYTDRVIDKRSYGIKMPRVDAGFMVNLPIPVPPLSEQIYIVDKVDEILSVIKKIGSCQDKYSNNLEVLINKIIDAGMQGKLTQQTDSEKSADILYEEIQEEKKKLIKEGKIKKGKKLSEIKDEEIPYDIPLNWKWVRIGNVINEVIVPQRDKPPFSGDIPWCRIEDRDGYYLNGTKSGQYVSKETVEEMNLRVCPVGTVLSACSGASIGTILITTVECCTNQTFNGLVCNSKLYNWYLFWYLKSVISKLKGMGTGSAMAYVSQDKIRNMIIPLPPYEEQIRIADTIDKALSVIGEV